MPPYNGSGTFTPYTPGNPVVSGTVISSTAFNSTQSDIAAGLTNAVTRDGQSPPTANLPMGGKKLTGLVAGTVAGDSLRWEQLFSQGTEQDLASAATTDIGAQNTTVLRITGTTGITSFGANYNGPRFVRFADVLILTHNATTLILPTGANITTAAGDRAILTPVGNPASGWQVLAYQRSNGTALNGVQAGAVTTSGLTMSADRILGRATAGVGAIEELTGTQAGALLPIRAPLQSATVTVNGTGGAPANGMLITVNPGTLDFRSATLGSGAINTRTISTAITGTITSGSTLGSVSGQITKLAILVIDNAGTPEVAWTNLSGRTLLDEKGLISTTAEGGSGGADSATTIYSNTARTNVPYRWVDVVEYTQATAGTYVTAPSKIYPVNSAIALSDLFRSWRDVTGSRSAGTLYRNDTDYDIDVAITSTASGSIQFNLAVDGDNKSVGAYSGASGIVWVGTTVPPHSTYQLNISAGTISTWKELRVS